MTATVPQVASARQVGFGVPNPYGSTSNFRRYGVTAEELRAFPNKDADEEDHRRFQVSDTMYMNYEKTNRETVYFQNSNSRYPNTLKLTFPKSSYPLRTDTAYFLFTFSVRIRAPKFVAPTLFDQEKSNAPTTPRKLIDERYATTMKLFKAIKQTTVTVGSNSAQVTFPHSCFNYQNVAMDFLVKPISESNASQEYMMADIVPTCLILDSKAPDTNYLTSLSDLLFKIINVDPQMTQNSDSEIDTRMDVNFVLPLTMLHPMFNFNTVIAPGLDVTVEFDLQDFKSIAESWFPLLPNITDQQFDITVRPQVGRCYLSIEQPIQTSDVLQSLKTKRYMFDVLIPQFFRKEIVKNAGQSMISNLCLKPPKSGMPSRMQFMLLLKSEFNLKNYSLSDVCRRYLDKIVFKINLPFPYQRTMIFNNTRRSTNDTFRDYSLAKAYYQSLDNFRYTEYGEEHVTRGVFPSISKINPMLQLSNSFPWKFETSEKDASRTITENIESFPYSLLLLPSDLFNQNPFPEVRGSLTCDLYFKDDVKADELQFVLFANFDFYHRIHIQNGKCLILPLDDLGVALDEAKR